MDSLSPRELQCARLFAQGHGYKTVAVTLGIRYATVHTHAQKLRLKLNATNLTHAIAILHQRGILP